MAINQTKPGLLNPLAAYNQARQPGGFLAPTENFQGFLTDPRASIGIQIAQGVPLGQAIFSGATQAQQLKELFNKELRIEEDFYKVISLIKKYKVIEECYQKAQHYINLASNSLTVFKDSKEKEIFKNLTSFSLTRNF